MKLISPRLHGTLDYITVVVLFLSPVLFNMDFTLAVFVYILAVIQLVLSIVTDYPFGVFRSVPFIVHGWIEAAIGVCLALFAAFFWYVFNYTGFYYCAVLAVIYLLVPLLTRFRPVARPNITAIL